jgi:UDP-N-acetylglucosamine--N-acetylmuramyl-(pentapeptide) pyrophosphoryl-undecaprenol N-acetylglucosamine transferase
MSARKTAKLLIAGGGTGGHVLAGVAIADAWKATHGPSASVLFVGAEGGLEEKLVPRAGYPLELLQLGSLNRVSITRKLKTLIQLPLSFLKSAVLLLKVRPDVVLGVGGYASGPVVLMARVLSSLFLIRTRTAILEQNSVPGFTNRLLGKLVHRVFAAFPGTERNFLNKEVLVTGNPIRSTMKLLPSAPRKPFTVFIFGGSQGAFGINTLMIQALPFLNDLKDQIRIIHQTGERDYSRVLEAYQNGGLISRIEKFIDDMPSAYRESSLLICRAGASTLAEIAAVGRASLLIPLPTAADNHQEENAQVFVRADAAILMNQNHSTGKDLARTIRELIQNPKRLDQMERQVTQFYRPHAAQDVVNGLTSLF